MRNAAQLTASSRLIAAFKRLIAPSSSALRRAPPPPPLPGPWPRIAGLESLASIFPRSLSAFSISRQARRLGRTSMTPPSGRAAVASPTTISAAPLGVALGNVMLSRRARRLIVSSWRLRALAQRRRGAGQRPAASWRRRHVHFRAHRADFRDQAHHPADLLVDLGVDESGEHRPLAERQKVLAFSPCSTVCAHSSSVMNGMNGCSSFRIWSSTQATRGARLRLRRFVVARQDGLMNSRYQSQKSSQTNW